MRNYKKFIPETFAGFCLGLLLFTTGCTKTELPKNASDTQAPEVSSVIPAPNATLIPVSDKPVVTFTEPVDAATVTSSSFTLKQGTTVVAGNVTASGATATFTPSAALIGNTVYTVSLTTTIKDLAGNQMTASYSWSFTTAAVAASGKSFSADVVPVLNLCNTCHTHGWTPSTTASTFYTNLVNGGYINSTTPTAGKIYQKLSGSHPSGSTISATQKSTVVTWITEGSKNN
jgi:hypothetical protein